MIKSVAILFSAFLIGNSPAPLPVILKPTIAAPQAKIQAAILLDVSNSMDGLIDQAKAQLWNMVSVMGRAKCEGQTPIIEIALYEYGRSNNNEAEGYVKQISAFTGNLDQLSKDLFSLSTNGGEEYCNTVVLTSLKNLKWDAAKETYKVIFIAGNEDYNQGKTTFTEACAKAREMGVIVNTIYCGGRQQGIQEHWNMGTECGNGSFTNINQDEKQEDIATPYDTILYSLNEKINNTFIAYGAFGMKSKNVQAEVDQLNYTANKSAAAKRVAVKGQKSIYKNDSWDMVDASEKDAEFYKKVEMKTLPDSLQNKSRAELKAVIEKSAADRAQVRKEIAEVSAKRSEYIIKNTATQAGKPVATLESAIEKIIKEQAARYNMLVQ